jgi:hypothetical protein
VPDRSPCVETRETTLEVRPVRSPRQPADARPASFLSSKYASLRCSMVMRCKMKNAVNFSFFLCPCDLTYAL